MLLGEINPADILDPIQTKGQWVVVTPVRVEPVCPVNTTYVFAHLSEIHPVNMIHEIQTQKYDIRCSLTSTASILRLCVAQ